MSCYEHVFHFNALYIKFLIDIKSFGFTPNLNECQRIIELNKPLVFGLKFKLILVIKVFTYFLLFSLSRIKITSNVKLINNYKLS